MRRLALILLLAPLLHASTFRFDPPAPTNDTTTTLTFSSSWNSGCPPPPTVSITAQRINLAFKPFVGACSGNIQPFTDVLNLGVLPAGVYEVVAFVDAPGLPPSLGSTKLVVRDVTTYAIGPYVGPTSGGTSVVIRGKEPFDVEPIHVLFGGVEVPLVRRIDDRTIEVTTLPHAAGPVDVVVQSVMGGTHTATAAFTFYDPKATTPDPFVFTNLLFPIDFAGAGAFGSQWTTENWIETGEGKQKLPVTGSVSGVVVPVLRTDRVAANSRIRDLSRAALTAGTGIPVVRENDFSDHVRLLNIPSGSNMRALLRVWTSGEAPFFYVNIDQIPSFAASVVPLQPAQGGLRYGTFDLTPFLNSPNEHLDLSAGVDIGTRMWGMVSITNNDTQQVTIVSP
ncbi:MAG TPA: IPT/TIG domain-containing protein [Thermoanaerobaculia bacterium]|nr:IPT/TIG domain-containing protein [Thermoanaerobaculia bacterium]